MKKSKKPRARKRLLKRPFDPAPIHPQHLYRWADGERFFGYSQTEIVQKIKAGQIPTPFPLTDGGRAKAWTGQQILDWQAERIAKAAAKAQA